MKTKAPVLTLALACSALFASIPAELSAGAPLKIGFQGRLEESGQPAEGTKNFVFKLYDAASDGSLVWTGASQPVALADGVFNAILSDGAPALSTAAFSGARYIEITVDGVPLSPRQEMVSAPYAMVAQALAPDAVLPPAQLLAGSVTDYHVLLTTASIGAGRFGDDRVLITTGAFTGGFNGGSQLVQLDGAGKLPASALTETDPLFVVSVSSLIVSGDIANWDAAYGWGSHASAGYETAAAHSASLTAYAALAATQTFSGMNTFASGVSMPIRSVSANTTLTDTDHTILANSTGGDITISLPSAVGRAGRICAVKKTALANNVLIAPQIGQTIDSVYNSNPGFENPLRLNSVDGWDSVMLQSDGGNWFILSAYQPPPGI